MYNIRDVNNDDAAFVQEAAVKFMEYYPLDVNYDLNVLLQVLENVADNGIFIVAEADGEAIGLIGGMISPYPYAPMHLVATEMFLWVKEEHRQSSAADQLVSAFEQVAEHTNCKFVSMCSTVHTPYFKEYLKSKHYSEAETAFVKEV
jgi:N-acetylglutamate synthase-like GNAT family acetyltransferase